MMKLAKYCSIAHQSLFCIMLGRMKVSINKGVIWIKTLYTLYGFAIMIILPYFPLQMASLGLDEVDISLITGIVPILVTFSTPILGLLSDTIGYKSVLFVDIILICLSTTSYIFIPGIEKFKQPFVEIKNDTKEIVSFHWPVCNENCTASWEAITQDNDWIEDINDYISCANVSLSQNEFTIDNESVGGGLFCSSSIHPGSNALNQSTFTCDIENYPDNFLSDVCDFSGNHDRTFWLVFGLQTLITVSFPVNYYA